MKLNKIILSFLFVVSADSMHAMNDLSKENLIEKFCGYLYGHAQNDNTEIDDQDLIKNPCSSPQGFSKNAQDTNFCSQEEMRWYLNASACNSTDSSESKEELHGQLVEVNKENLLNSPASAAVSFSPIVGSNRKKSDKKVIFYPGCVVDEKEFGNSPCKKGILKRTTSLN